MNFPPTTNDPDVWPFCPACVAGRHQECDPLRFWCSCWACLPNDHEIPQPREGT